MKKISTIASAQIQLLVTCVAIFVGAGFISGCRIEGLPPIQAVEGTPILFGTTFFDLAKLGYQQREYFISGDANSYIGKDPLQPDGKWNVQVVDSAAFKTRIVVYSPMDPAKFNGTVIFEWLNVSGGAEAGTDWIGAHTELASAGYIWVGVSAQVTTEDTQSGAL